ERRTVRDPGKGGCVALVDNNGARKHLPRKFEAVAAKLINNLASAKIIVVCLHVARGDFLNLPLFLVAEHHTQSAGDVLSDFILDGKNIFELPVISLRPHRVTAAGLGEPGGDAQTAARSTDASFEHERGP